MFRSVGNVRDHCGTGCASVSYLREHVTYLLAQALKAREAGNYELAFVAMAVRCDDAANEIEKAAKSKAGSAARGLVK